MSLEDIISGLPNANIQEDLYRNIVSLRQSEHLFDDLSTNSDDWETAIAVELLSKEAGYVSPHPIINRPFEEAKWFNAIGFPFDSNNWMESRYSNGKYGVWYGASDLETTIHETVHHWLAFLSGPGFLKAGVVQERRVHMVHCNALLVDLRPSVASHPKLIAKEDYSFTQQVGERLQREGHPGLCSKSARGIGDIYAVFTPKVLSDQRHFCYLTYRTITGGRVNVERSPGKVFLSI